MGRGGAGPRLGRRCSTAPPSRPPTPSTWRRSAPISSRSRSTRCSATPPAVGPSSPAARRSPSCARPWFAGGTITLASVQDEGWYRLAPGATGFEDGTIDYLGLPAVSIGVDHVEAVGIDVIHTRVSALGGWLLEEIPALRHGDGAPLIRCLRAAGLAEPRRHRRAYTCRSVGAALRRLRRRGGSPLASGSRCAPAASATRATERSRTGSRATTWRAVSPIPRLRPSGAVPADHRGRHRQGSQHHPRLARPRLGLRRRLPLHGVRRELPGPRPGLSAARPRRGRHLRAPHCHLDHFWSYCDHGHRVRRRTQSQAQPLPSRGA